MLLQLEGYNFDHVPDLAPFDGAPSQADGLDEPAILVAHQFSPLQHKPALFPVSEADPLKEAIINGASV